MEYTQHNWTTGETVTSNKLNHIENGIANAATEINELDENAIKMSAGEDGQILEKDSNAQGGVKWVDKPIGNGEDINQNEEGKFQFANRTYNTLQPSGMGYKILRKDANFEDQVTEANTTYEIRYDFDLGGAPVTVPSNCVLFFNGGVIKNGIINGDRTTIESPQVKISENVLFRGTWINESCYLSWFGCETGDGVDNSEEIENATKSSFSQIVVDGVYCISKPVDTMTKVFVGNSILNFNRAGFKANDNFTSITISDLRDAPTSHTIYGMFYHHFDNHPVFKNLYIDGNKVAKYCVEHVAGYSNTDFYNVNIKNALVAGILQYGCERPIYDTLYVSDCQIGIYISSKKINESDYFDFSGAEMGQPNLVIMKNVRTINNNYGWILYNNYNTAMYSCEGGYNYLTGLYAESSAVTLVDYYTEGDGMCDKYIDANGIVVSGATSPDGTLVPDYLLTNNLDGFSSYTAASFNHSLDDVDKTVLYRAPMVFVSGTAEISSMVSSNYPRGCRGVSEPFNSIVNPNERLKAGVDCIIINYACSIDIGTHKVYVGSGNNPDSADFFATYIMCCKAKSSPYGCINAKFLSRGKTIYYGSYSASIQGFKDDNASRSVISKIENVNWQNYNDSIFDFTKEKIVEFYKGYPLFGLDDITSSSSTHNNRNVNATLSDVAKWFRGKRQVVIRFLVHVVQNYSAGNLGLVINPLDASNNFIGTSCNILMSGTLIKEGYYDFYIPVTLDFDSNFVPNITKYSISYRIPKDVAHLNISQLYIYSPESGVTNWGNNFKQIPSVPTSERPVSVNESKIIYDSTLKKCILYNGTDWVNMDGSALT